MNQKLLPPPASLVVAAMPKCGACVLVIVITETDADVKMNLSENGSVNKRKGMYSPQLKKTSSKLDLFLVSLNKTGKNARSTKPSVRARTTHHLIQIDVYK